MVTWHHAKSPRSIWTKGYDMIGENFNLNWIEFKKIVKWNCQITFFNIYIYNIVNMLKIKYKYILNFKNIIKC